VQHDGRQRTLAAGERLASPVLAGFAVEVARVFDTT
jgi:hypothetical protein